jgi:pimeloyl-ACP methyl ester carboxylesterase
LPRTAPPVSLAALEIKGLGAIALSALRPALKVAGAGARQPVITIPGMMSGDRSISFLSRSLGVSGFDARKSGIMFHAVATRHSVALVEQRLAAIHAETGRKVALIGWSLGGLYARILAHRQPQMISVVMTLGTPFSGDPHANNAWRLYELLSGHKVTQSPFAEDFAQKPPVPTVAFWSPNDGIVSPENARGLPDESDRQVQVSASHFELATRSASVRRIIEVLGDVLDSAASR